MNQNLLLFILRNFWRMLGALCCLLLGLLWACFGWQKTLVILCLSGLGFYFGKWVDEGRPGGGWLRFLSKYLD
jgi:uncharacterized membrane protein